MKRTGKRKFGIIILLPTKSIYIKNPDTHMIKPIFDENTKYMDTKKQQIVAAFLFLIIPTLSRTIESAVIYSDLLSSDLPQTAGFLT